MKKIRNVLIIILFIAVLTGCKNIFVYENEKIEYLSGKYYAEMKVKDYGVIEMELDADVAPITVTNFMKLVNEGFYDNNKIHRVLKNFVIQGGEDYSGKEGNIKGEFDANGVSNDISHVRGTISMARAGDANSGFDTASTQFFIVQKDSTYLDHYYAGFGKVIKGMEVVDKICDKVKTVDDNGTILNDDEIPTIEYINEIEK